MREQKETYKQIESFHISEELKQNCEKVNKTITSEQTNDGYLFISNNVNTITQNTIDKRQVLCKEIGTDTLDLNPEETFNFENLKKNYINTMISWSFLKKLSEFNQWPLGCIGNFIENSLKEEVEAKNIWIEMRSYNKHVYLKSEETNDEREKILTLSVKDDGLGIGIVDFNQILYAFSINEKKEYNFFKYGVSLKTSAIRLANSFLLISKTDSDASIGLISKSLQVKLDSDFIMTPIVNYTILQENNTIKYIPKSNFAGQSLSLILQEIKFLFKEESDFFNYLNSFSKGTHIILYDLKQISADKNEINKFTNYELFWDKENSDILFNYFYALIGDKNFIDCSLSNYLSFFSVKASNININLFEKKINMINPYKTIYNISKNLPDVKKIHTNLKCPSDMPPSNCMYFEGNMYKGILFNRKFIETLEDSENYALDGNEKNLFNGILLYNRNRLVCRMDQNNLGDISYFIKKLTKLENSNIFKFSGFIEVPSNIYEVLNNKMVILFNCRNLGIKLRQLYFTQS